jgi:ribosomal-protein-alanine N-acetyltransferase
MNIYESIQTLQTERLILRRFIPSDAKDVLAVKKLDRVKIHRISTISTNAEAETFVDKKANMPANKKGISWAIISIDGGNWLGSIELTCLPDDTKEHIREIGFYVGIPYRRNGYAREAIKCVTASAFAIHEDLQRIHAEVLPNNKASFHTLKDCRFSQEGILKCWNMGEVNGLCVPVDLVMFALTRSEQDSILTIQN